MDDLSQKISEIMSDPQALQQIKGLGEMLGLTNTSKPEIHSKAENITETKPSIPDAFSNPDALSLVSKFMPLLSDINKEDDTTRLLLALRPFLSVERREKLDKASKLIKMLKLIPLAKDFGLFDTLF